MDSQSCSAGQLLYSPSKTVTRSSPRLQPEIGGQGRGLLLTELTSREVRNGLPALTRHIWRGWVACSMCWGQAVRSLILVPKVRLREAPEADIVEEVVVMWYREGGRE